MIRIETYTSLHQETVECMVSSSGRILEKIALNFWLLWLFRKNKCYSFTVPERKKSYTTSQDSHFHKCLLGTNCMLLSVTVSS
jgi:hypothetical protein